jgi:O-antigen/teichoic acid export membrane protein
MPAPKMTEFLLPDGAPSEDAAPRPEGLGARSGVLVASAPVLLAKILSTIFLAGLAVVTARALGPSGRGVLVLMITIPSFTTLLGTLGVNLAARIRMVAQTAPVSLDEYLGVSGMLVALQAPVAALAVFVLLPLTGVHVSLSRAVIVGLFGAATLADIFLLHAFFAFGRTAEAAAVDAGGSLAQLLLVIAVLVAGKTNPDAVLVAMTAGAAIQAVANLLALQRLGMPIRPRWSVRVAGELIHEGYPGIGLALGQALTFRVDRYIAGLFLVPASVGIYSVSATGSETLRLLPYAVSEVVFYKAASARMSETDLARVVRIVTVSFVAALALAAATASWVVPLAFGDAFRPAIGPLRILLLGEGGMCVYFLNLAIAVPRGGMRGIAAASVAGLLLVCVLDVVLIPRMGIAGAAWASVVAYWLMGVWAWLLARRFRRADVAAPA